MSDERFDAAKCAVHSEQIEATTKAVSEMRDEFRATVNELRSAAEQNRIWQATIVGQIKTAGYIYGAFQAVGLLILGVFLSWLADNVHFAVR